MKEGDVVCYKVHRVGQYYGSNEWPWSQPTILQGKLIRIFATFNDRKEYKIDYFIPRSESDKPPAGYYELSAYRMGNSMVPNYYVRPATAQEIEEFLNHLDDEIGELKKKRASIKMMHEIVVGRMAL